MSSKITPPHAETSARYVPFWDRDDVDHSLEAAKQRLHEAVCKFHGEYVAPSPWLKP